MEERSTMTSDPSTPWTGGAVLVAVVVGVGMLMLWRLWGRCCRQLDMRRVVETEKAVLYRFLSDPENLKLIHPHTTEIRVNTETEEEGGVTLKEFDWVEKVPFKVVSAARMRCDPTTSTITMDIVPAGGIHEVRLKWWLKPNNHRCSNLSEETQQTHQPTDPQEPGLSTDTKTAIHTDSADDKRTTTPSESADDEETTVSRSADEKAATTDDPGSTDKESRCTEFHNQIRVTGPCVLVVYVIIKIIESIEVKLMDRVQQHFKDSSK